MLRITCPHCQSKLNAKEKLIGQTRKCPKCGQDVLIQPRGTEVEPTDLARSASDQSETVPVTEETPTVHVEPPQEPERLAQVEAVADPPTELKPPNRYLICDRQRIIAVWEGDGSGWQLTSPTGLISAKRNTEQIPSQGVFRFIDLKIERSEQGMHLAGIACHELAPRWAMPSIGRGDNPILEKIVGPSGLSRDQKQMIRRYLQDNFMSEVWRNRQEVVDFLSDDNFHTQGVA